MIKVRNFLFGLSLSCLCFSVHGQTFEELVKKGDEYFAKRSTMENCLKSIDYYSQACALNPKDIPVRLKLGRLAYWTAGELGEKTMDKKQRLELLRKSVKASEEVLKMDPRNPGGHYWRMWSLAGVTVAEGVLSGGYSFKEAIVGTIFVANGDINYFYGGIYRYWARVIYEIPGILGKFFHFSEPDAIWLYEQALKAEPNFFKTRFWMAESYVRMKDKPKAIDQLKYIIKTPAESLPDAQIENRFYQEQARKLLAGLEQ